MKKLSLWGFFILLAVVLYFLRPHPVSSPERDAIQAISKYSPWKPSPSAKPVTEGRSPPVTMPAANTKPNRKTMTKAERAQWAAGVQTQMKISLAATYGGEKSFYSEYRRYSTDYNSIGYYPEESEIPFKVGFIRAFNPAKPIGPTEGTSHPAQSLDELDQYQQELARANGNEVKPMNFGESAKGVKIEDAAQYCQSECTASETGFEAIAVANLDDDPDLDVWIINDKKVMVHVHDDLAN